MNKYQNVWYIILKFRAIHFQRLLFNGWRSEVICHKRKNWYYKHVFSKKLRAQTWMSSASVELGVIWLSKSSSCCSCGCCRHCSVSLCVCSDWVKLVELKCQCNASKNYAPMLRNTCNGRIMGSNVFWCKHSKLSWVSVTWIFESVNSLVE